MTTAYTEFLATKREIAPSVGIEVDVERMSPWLFGFQRDLARWALRKGRSAIFADTGLGKTRMQLEWARLVCEVTGGRVLILAPLSVARQTATQGREELGLPVVYARSQADAGTITVTNYEMVQHFDVTQFVGVVLDESSILKATEGVTRNLLIDLFARTPYRLCCTATPAPNDIAEITNHSDFLGIMPRRDVLATFFRHDADGAAWRLKNHARAAFWRWLASWGMSLKHPSDLGYADEGFRLPHLEILPAVVASDVTFAGRLFADQPRGVTERAAVRKQTKDVRVAETVRLVEAEGDEPWIAWCGLNDEGRDVAKALGDRAILVEGSQSPEEKATRIEAFMAAPNAVLVTKPTIAGFGMNFQHCARMAFVGIGDSYEQYYQAIRRCWRYGQSREVRAHVVVADVEQAIYQNVLRKEHEAAAMAAELVQHVASYELAEIGRIEAGLVYDAEQQMEVPAWLQR
ncbi:MAG: SNF2-related protein [Dehalococcoidia bacterium]